MMHSTSAQPSSTRPTDRHSTCQLQSLVWHVIYVTKWLFRVDLVWLLRNCRVISADIEVAWVHLRQLVLVICILSFGERFLDEALASWTEAGVSVAGLDSLTAYTCSILHCLCWSLVTDDLYKYTVSTLHMLAFWLPALCSHAKAFLSF